MQVLRNKKNGETGTVPVSCEEIKPPEVASVLEANGAAIEELTNGEPDLVSVCAFCGLELCGYPDRVWQKR